MAALLPACTPASNGLHSADVEFKTLHFRVVTIDLAKAPLALYWRNPDSGQAFTSIAALQSWGMAARRKLLFATNAGIYDARHQPLGLHIENSKTLRPLNTVHGNPAAGNFSLLPNGVFAIDAAGHASVQTTQAFAARQAAPQWAAPRWATQSGPMLVIDGQINAQFIADSDSRKWRSGVCARKPGEVTFVVSIDPVNFHTFADFFRSRLGCRDALYLDGTLSQIYVAGEYYGAPAFMVKPYAGMFAVFETR